MEGDEYRVGAGRHPIAKVPTLAELRAMREAVASVALDRDGQTQHAPQADWLCCLDHAGERIAELEAEVSRLEDTLRTVERCS